MISISFLDNKAMSDSIMNIVGNISAIAASNGNIYTIADEASRLSIDELYDIKADVSSASRIDINNLKSDLSILEMSCSEFYLLVNTSATVSNCMYVVECDFKNIYGQQIKNVAAGTDLSDAVTLEQLSNAMSDILIPTDLSSFTNSPGYLSAVPSIYALKSDILMSYHLNEHKIVLSAGTNITSVDCTDFIKDGMLSSVELCGTLLVLNFNTDAGSDPISVELSNFIDDYDEKISNLSTTVDLKIYIDGISALTLSATHISQDDFYQRAITSTLLSNELYVVSSDYINTYGLQIKNLSAGTDLSDAVTLQQLNDAISSLDAENIWEADEAADSAKRKITTATPVVAGSESTVISQGALATGVANVAGLKGYRYTNTGNVTNSLTFATAPTGWAVGDVVSIVNSEKYENCAMIASISGTTVTFTENLPFMSIEDDDGWDAKLVYVSEKPTVGDIEIGYGAYAEGLGTKALNVATHAEGLGTKALGHYAHAEGRETIAQYAAHAEGYGTQAIEEQAHSEGYYTTASGKHSHAEGCRTLATKTCAHSEGENTAASGNQSHSEGYGTIASASQAHAEGNNTKATANLAHAEGNSTTASGTQSHAEGFNTTSGGGHSHSEGSWTNASGNFSHAEGRYTIALNAAEHAEGQFNKSNKVGTDFGNAGNTIHSIGIGTSNTNRKNAVEVMLNGKIYIKDAGGYDGTNPTAANVKDLATLVSSKLEQNDVNISYSNLTIWLSSKQHVTSVDCTDFIKDGMLSSAELCGTALVFKFNTDAGSNPISVELSNFVDDYDGKITYLSNEIDQRRKLDDLSVYETQDYWTCDGDTFIYKEIYPGTEIYPATFGWENTSVEGQVLYYQNGTWYYAINAAEIGQSQGQEDAASIEIPSSFDDDVYVFTRHKSSSAVAGNRLATTADLTAYLPAGNYLSSNALANYYKKTETSSSNEISSELKKYQLSGNYLSSNALDNYKIYNATVSSLSDDGYALIADAGSKVLVDGAKSDISILHMSKQEYDLAEDQGNILSNALYIVSGDYVDHLEDAAGNRISANLCCIAAGSQTPSMIATLDQLSAIDEKVTVIDRISGITDLPNLSIIKLSAEEYEDLVYDGGILSNAIYIIDQEYLDQYGQQIKNLGAPTDLSDAATKQYVDNSISSIQIPTDLSDFTNSPNFATLEYVNQVLGDIESIINNL